VSALEAPLEVWRNVSGLRVTTASGVQHSHVNTAVGYGCASDRRVHFGLGPESVVKELRADRIITVREDEASPNDPPPASTP